MSRSAIGLAAVLLGGCLDASVTRCDGYVCPVGATCSAVHGCVVDEQVTACTGRDEGDACTFAGSAGRCDAGACIVLTCGDGVRNDPEPCDGADLGGATCDANGFHGGGPPSCTPSCTLDLSSCEGRCGDGNLDDPEVCEGSQLTATCADFGFYDAAGLACTDICTFDTSGCRRSCGDGILDPEEECEAGDLGGADCTDLGFYDPAGLGCDPFCRFDVALCHESCGDGVINGEEVCDGAPPDGRCVDFFFDRGHLSCSRGCAPGFDTCRDIGLAEMAPALDMSGGVWASAADRIFAVRGTEVYWFDGVTWSTVAATSGAALTDVWGAETGEVVAVGSAGAVLRFDGASWSESDVGSSVTLNAVWGAAIDDVYAAGAGGEIHHHDGMAWSLADVSQSVTYEDLWGSGPTDVFAVGAAGVILHFDGSGWTAMASGTTRNLFGVGGSGPGDVYAVGLSDTVLHHDGVSWRPLPTTTTAIRRAVAASAVDEVLVSGNDTLLHDGYSWWPLDHPYVVISSASVDRGDVVAATTVPVARFRDWGWTDSNGTGAAVFGLDRRHVYAVGGTSVDQVRMFDGTSWTALANVEPADCASNGLHDVWASAPDDIFAVGRCMAFLHFDGSAWTWWTDSVDDANGALRGLWASGPDDVFAVGDVHTADDTAAIYHYDGVAWTRQASGMSLPLLDVWGSGPDDVFAVGVYGGITHYDGTSWTPQVSGVTTELTGVWGTGPADVWAVGEFGVVLHHDGSTWSTVDLGFPEEDLTGVWGSGPTDVFIAGKGGFLLHDDGLGFAPVTAPFSLRGPMWGGNTNVFFADSTVLARALPATCAAAEGACTDTYDDDCDGATDCADADCAAAAACEATELSCRDRFDNDGDRAYDCGDPDCAGECACAGAAPIVCGQSLDGSTLGGASDVTSYGCAGGRAVTGPERVYTFVPSVSGSVTVSLTGMSADLDLVVVGQTAARECDPAGACIDDSQTTGNETITFTAVRGATYYVHVDGYDGAAGGYTLTATCW